MILLLYIIVNYLLEELNRMKSRKLTTLKTKKRKIKPRKTRKKGGQINNSGLEVRYSSGIVQGQIFTKEETSEAPHVFFTPKESKLYTIIMWDPDAPAKPSWVHWIVTNLLSSEQIHQNTVLSYQGPNPPSGTHRYYFGLFEQTQGKIHPMISGVRGGFDYQEFIRDNKLNKVSEVNFKVEV